MSTNQEIGQRLTKAREASNLSREAVAERLGVSLSTVQAHENGRNGVKPDMAKAYCRIYKISLEWLFNGDGAPGEQAAEVVDIWNHIIKDEDRRDFLDFGRWKIDQQRKNKDRA